MKLEELEENKYLIFLNNLLIDDFDILDEKSIRTFLKKLFVKIMKIYKITLAGYYQVDIYYDEKIGMFIELVQLDDYGNLSSSIDLKISIDIKDFYLQFKDLEFIDNYNLYINDDNIYIKTSNLNSYDILKLIEYAKVIYRDVDCDKVN